MTETNLEDQLQAYFDGELASAEADAMRARLEIDAELRAKLDGLAHLRTLLRAALAPAHLEAPDGDALFAAIEGELASNAGGADPAVGLRVLDGGRPQGTRIKPTASPSLRSRWIGVAGLGLAAAAALLFFVLRPTEPGVGGGDPAPIASAPPPGSEIEEIDFGHSTGAIFQVEEDGAQYAVVWISDEKAEDLVNPTSLDLSPDRIQ